MSPPDEPNIFVNAEIDLIKNISLYKRENDKSTISFN